MPNWVYSSISINSEMTTERKAILEKIAEKGICEYYRPMPPTLNITSGSTVDRLRAILKHENGVLPDDFDLRQNHLTEKDVEEARLSFMNERLYRFKDWYDWRNANYGTKWGDCGLEIIDDTITFQSACSPIHHEIIEQFAEDFPDFIYTWEEEQGFGAEYEFHDGYVISEEEWGIPDLERHEVEDESDDIWELKTKHRNNEVGFYEDYNLEYRLGDTLEEAVENLKNI